MNNDSPSLSWSQSASLQLYTFLLWQYCTRTETASGATACRIRMHQRDMGNRSEGLWLIRGNSMQDSRKASISWNAQNVADFSNNFQKQRAWSPRAYIVQYEETRKSLCSTLGHYAWQGDRRGEQRQRHCQNDSVHPESSKITDYTEVMLWLKPALTGGLHNPSSIHWPHITYWSWAPC